MGARWLRLSLPAFGLGLFACNAVLGTDDLTTVGGDGGSVLATLPSPGGGADAGHGTSSDEDANADANGNAGPDAGGDAVVAVAPSPCVGSGIHALCDDFEPDLGAAWQLQDVTGAFLTVTDSKFVSPPNALHAEKRVSTSSARSRLIAVVPQAAARTTCDLDLFVAQLAPANAALMLFAISYRAGADYVEYDLRTTTSGSSLLEYGTVAGAQVDQSTELAVPIPMNRWAHVRMDVRLAPAAAIDIAIDGKASVAKVPSAVVAGGSNQIFVGGVLEFATDMTWDVYVDNVVCDSQP